MHPLSYLLASFQLFMPLSWYTSLIWLLGFPPHPFCPGSSPCSISDACMEQGDLSISAGTRTLFFSTFVFWVVSGFVWLHLQIYIFCPFPLQNLDIQLQLSLLYPLCRYLKSNKSQTELYLSAAHAPELLHTWLLGFCCRWLCSLKQSAQNLGIFYSREGCKDISASSH